MEGDDRAPADARVPALAEECDLTALKLDPFGGFIASRIDGRAGLQEIADSTGATMDQVLGVIASLEMSGVLSWVEPPRVSRPRPKPSSGRKRRPLQHTPGRGTVRTRPPPPGASRVLYDPAELEEADVDLDVDRRRTILDTFYRLSELDHYQLLGVPRDADKKAIREAYFQLSKQFHPDTLYGKRLGSYKAKMEAVFKRLTDAYDVLGRKKKRAEYDEYLRARDQLMGIERAIEAGEEAATALEKEVREVAAAAVVEPDAAPADGAPKEETPGASRPPRRPPLDPRERRARARALLEKRLRGATSSQPPSRPPSQPPPARASRDDLLKGLARSLRRAATVTGGSSPVDRHVRDATAAEEAGDLVGAVNALRLATTLAPEREDLQERLRRLHARLSEQLADTYERQAAYEEEMENWAAAARNWAKVAQGRPGKTRPLRRAAQALLKAGGDLRQARDHALRAVSLQPDVAANRRVLAEVFLAAEMTVSARKELEEAARLDPQDEMVKNLLRQLK